MQSIQINFILAGNAIFTVENTTTNNRYTFRVRQPNSRSPHFVQVLTGPNNTQDYTFLGTIFDGKTYRHGKKSPINYNAESEKVFSWLWNHINNLPSNIKLYHEGYCGVCGRKLTTPESIKSGIGPIG